ncbi:MAG: F0F1 ATP synthase subunit B [Planctomycetes bacterium]|nr:F0F1 ATP synthase subunit B [Planctomycetota bacterium]
MKMRGIIVVLWLVLVLTMPVLASETGESDGAGASGLFGGWVGEYFWALIWFGALLLVLWKFAWKPLLAGLTNRQTHIEKQITDAEKSKTEAKKVLEEYGAKLADAERQGRDIISARTQQAEQQAKEVSKQNQKDIEQMKIRAEAELDRERIEAEDGLWDQAGDIVRRLGEEVFGKSLDSGDNQKLVDEAINRLKEQERK